MTTAQLSPEAQPIVEEPKPTWYAHEKRKMLGIPIHFLAGASYVLVALAPLLLYALFEAKAAEWAAAHPVASLIWAVVVALGYQTWAWFEARLFEPWVRTCPAEQRPIERAYFKLNSDLAKSFCAGVVAIYTVVALLGIALKHS